MTVEPELPAEIKALAEAIRSGAIRLPPTSRVPPGDVPTGLDSRIIQEAVAEMTRQGVLLDSRQIDDRIRTALNAFAADRRIPSADDIRSVAKEVAATLFRELVAPIEGDVRQHLTQAEIESVIYRVLTGLGIPAEEKEDRRTTKNTMEALFRGYRMRSRIGNSFVDEIAKALVGQLIGGGIIVGLAAVVWKALSAGAHP